MKWIAYILWGFCVIAVSMGVLFGVAMYRYVNTTVPNAYAVWCVADIVILHMEANDGDWPTGWDDLRDDHATRAGSDDPRDFKELQERVEVDWLADPAALVTASPDYENPPFNVIRLRDGRREYWGGAEPNQLILDYLRERPEYGGPWP
ncbi:hypothetical protein OT109_05030 [Phycisphaeraceae bacterium D3-23]